MRFDCVLLRIYDHCCTAVLHLVGLRREEAGVAEAEEERPERHFGHVSQGTEIRRHRAQGHRAPCSRVLQGAVPTLFVINFWVMRPKKKCCS